MTDTSEEYEDQEYSEDSAALDDVYDDSELDYTESESSTDSYVYPWPTSSEDSWADLSTDEVIPKILMKLPQYDPPDSNEEDIFDDGHPYSRDVEELLSSHSDSFVERDDEILNDLKQRAIKYHRQNGINESDYQTFMADIDMDRLDDMDEEFLLARYPMAMDSQLTEFIPDLYLAKIELFQIYQIPGEDDQDNGYTPGNESGDERKGDHGDDHEDDTKENSPAHRERSKTPSQSIGQSVTSDTDDPVASPPINSEDDRKEETMISIAAESYPASPESAEPVAGSDTPKFSE